MNAAEKFIEIDPAVTVDMVLTADPHIGDMPCPHCGHETFRRSSRLITPTYREIFFACRNIACGHTFKGSLGYLYGISPSAIPNPALDLPLRPFERSPALCAAGPESSEADTDQLGLFDT
ncbi:ogr/Delta-like zinc finger family protein [Novosphingobium sp.]|jgi:predicted RNA-binding Zn-ribbon protein involved in translation (DUF1610 family)|uniref:ogr/Delta-like zinc finger family protein n=1 Tax=Novosphingobium sp. TaxID=1874826 RepID=UPI0025E5BA9B|nr:ogr/Delta-like zinc finger family protein [Novosphingobium sp.]